MLQCFPQKKKNPDRIKVATQSYSRNSIEKLLDGKIGYDELLTLGNFLLFSFTEELVLLGLSCRGSDRTLSESTGHFCRSVKLAAVSAGYGRKEG